MRLILRLLPVLVAVLFVIPSAKADTVCTIQSQTILDNLDDQLAKALGSSKVDVQTQAIKNILHFARTCGDKVHFEKVVPRLVDLYEASADETQHAVAEEALMAIGDNYAARALEQAIDRSGSSASRQRALKALSELYSNKTGGEES